MAGVGPRAPTGRSCAGEPPGADRPPEPGRPTAGRPRPRRHATAAQLDRPPSIDLGRAYHPETRRGRPAERVTRRSSRPTGSSSRRSPRSASRRSIASCDGSSRRTVEALRGVCRELRHEVERVACRMPGASEKGLVAEAGARPTRRPLVGLMGCLRDHLRENREALDKIHRHRRPRRTGRDEDGAARAADRRREHLSRTL